ncbi:agmatine hydroxycinnamoyltransferase 1 [Brachypodium distachyon]|uniref:Uncharacterized protein n=1 Tax=Brachypodium distachyon TaxID=15368 RepID=A0A0Q3RLI2_BRADI|nr:agmatine hydroxycinnamoyltransferase 1 [Brachypodium distachyon]KQK13770.1 hypothetical protein BRADI_1g12370v3 [Brachypodium distachyon]|eukprot:XP_014758885.1 agmatine hydroxycinnamoyltransferase 1 [Brachypodium distachyon]
MKVKIESSKIVKPLYDDGTAAPPPGAGGEWSPLSVFDKVTYTEHVALIYAFRPPSPPNSDLELGLAKALAVYREMAGRLGDGPDGLGRSVHLNDAGARFVEASVDGPLAASLPLLVRPSPVLKRLHPSSIDDDDGRPAEELVLVQLTRFSCGSLVLGFAGHHQIADGQSAGNFLVAWGLATRRISPVAPAPVCDRATRFAPRDPPLVAFPHRETEYKLPPLQAKKKHETDEDDDEEEFAETAAHEKVKVHKMHLSKEFVARLKARAAAASSSRGYTTFQSVVAHLWRAITAARGLGAGVGTKVRISVSGRTRMRPPVPRDGYFGNLVLWAFPRADAGDLVARPLGHAAELVRAAVAAVDDAYFRSFVDFASSGVVEAEGLVPTADSDQTALCPNLELDTWLGINFCDLDFGGGCPFYFMPTYFPMEGSLFLAPSFLGDGGMEAYVSLFDNHLEEFKKICYKIA